MKARVFVTLKNGVLDPQGKAIGHALNGLGFEQVGEVRQGKVIDRVQLQPGRSIVGFGRGGVVYLVAGEDEPASMLEKTRWRAP